eukprot:UC1_evm1s959
MAITSSYFHLGDVRVGTEAKFRVGIRNTANVEVRVCIDLRGCRELSCSVDTITIRPHQLALAVFSLRPRAVDPDFSHSVVVRNLLDPGNNQELVVQASHIDLVGAAFHNLFYTINGLGAGDLDFGNTANHSLAVRSLVFKNHTDSDLALDVDTPSNTMVQLYRPALLAHDANGVN